MKTIYMEQTLAYLHSAGVDIQPILERGVLKKVGDINNLVIEE